jgi:hypothetical protein
MPDAEEDEGEAEDAVGGARVRDCGIWGGEARWGAGEGVEEVEDEWGVLM